MGCTEELIPIPPSKPCPDMSQVPNPMRDWPAIPTEELEEWQSQKRAFLYCRAKEILRREEEKPGSQSGVLELAWMYDQAFKNHKEKTDAVYEASLAYDIPVQTLIGGLYQESLFSELGIASDGGNYSCGIGQANLLEWCGWASEQSEDLRQKLSWPNVKCSELSLSLVKPFYQVALKKLKGEPEYKLGAPHFQGIQFQDVVKDFPSAPEGVQRKRFAAVQSFVNHCSKISYGIAAHASALAAVFRSAVPQGLKAREIYPPGEKFQRACQRSGGQKYYPLHTGWVLAVGMFNAGPGAADMLAYYNQWDRSDLTQESIFANFTPQNLIEAFYWGGKYNPSDDKIHFTTLNGQPASWIWFKSCVLQRHIARVVQHVTLPGIPNLAASLEGAAGCARSVFDPKTGDLVKTSVPPARRVSSGIREQNPPPLASTEE